MGDSEHRNALKSLMYKANAVVGSKTASRQVSVGKKQSESDLHAQVSFFTSERRHSLVSVNKEMASMKKLMQKINKRQNEIASERGGPPVPLPVITPEPTLRKTTPSPDVFLTSPGEQPRLRSNKLPPISDDTSAALARYRQRGRRMSEAAISLSMKPEPELVTEEPRHRSSSWSSGEVQNVVRRNSVDNGFMIETGKFEINNNFEVPAKRNILPPLPLNNETKSSSEFEAAMAEEIEEIEATRIANIIVDENEEADTVVNEIGESELEVEESIPVEAVVEDSCPSIIVTTPNGNQFGLFDDENDLTKDEPAPIPKKTKTVQKQKQTPNNYTNTDNSNPPTQLLKNRRRMRSQSIASVQPLGSNSKKIRNASPRNRSGNKSNMETISEIPRSESNDDVSYSESYSSSDNVRSPKYSRFKQRRASVCDPMAVHRELAGTKHIV